MLNGRKTVALCTSRVYDPNTHGFIERLNEKLKSMYVQLFVYAINADVYWDEDAITADAGIFDEVPFEKIDALIIMDEKIKSHRIAEKLIFEAKRVQVPVIVIDGFYEGTVSIGFDYAGGFEAVVRHVVEDHGIRDLHYMAGFRGNKFSEERKGVFKKVLCENGIAFDEEEMVSYGEFWATPARVATQKLIDEKRVPGAIICANDVMALNVVDVLQKGGYSVPGDVAVTGFDGYGEVFISTPAIATVKCEITEEAETAANVAVKLMNGYKVDLDECMVMPKVIPNESCGCERCVKLADDVAMNRINNKFYRYQDDIGRIHETIGKMMTAESLEKAVSCIQRDFAKYMCCITKKECFDTDKNFFLEKPGSTGYCLVYDSGAEGNNITDFDKEDIIPRLSEVLEGGYPLIFQPLDYMGKYIGYACYYYQTYDIFEYSKTPNISDMIGAGIGGYVNMRCQKYLLAKVESMYKIDALTGLFNRLAFMKEFDDLKNDPDTEGEPVTVLMTDLNHLKNINDSLGHDAGDRAIASVANALKSNCPDNSLCVRFGGDELLAFIPGECDVDSILKNISRDLKGASKSNGFEITASCGSYKTILSPDLNFEEALKHADKQMYMDKVRSRKKSSAFSKA